jgi:hypothetical protein
LFLAALAFPNGVSELWNRLEKEVRSGARILRILLAFGFVEAYLIIDKLGWLPRALSLTEFAGIEIKYWILIIAAAVLCWGRMAHSAIPLFGLSWFVLTEAFGLMPSSFAVLKYLLVLLTVGVYVGLETGGVSTLTRRLQRFRAGNAPCSGSGTRTRTLPEGTGNSR